MKKINYKSLIISLAISLGVGLAAALLSNAGSNFYETVKEPPLAPPSWLFPVVWSILYFLMGVSAYMVYESGNPVRRKALTVYGVQLALNFIWSLVFFNSRAFTSAFVLIIILWIAVVVMTALFHKCRPLAGYLQVPYVLWLTFTAYLNFAINSIN